MSLSWSPAVSIWGWVSLVGLLVRWSGVGGGIGSMVLISVVCLPLMVLRVLSLSPDVVSLLSCSLVCSLLCGSVSVVT